MSGRFEFLGVFLTSTHAPTKRPASRPLRRSHSALWTLTSAELPPKSNPVTDWHRQAGTRLSLGPRTHRAGQPDKSACPALHLAENDYICRVRQIVIHMKHTCILWGLLILGLVSISCKCNRQSPNIVVKDQSINAENYPGLSQGETIDLPESILKERQKHVVPDEWIDARLRNARKDSILHDEPSFEEMSLDAALNYYGRPDEMLKYGDTLILGYGAYSYYFVRDTLIWKIVD